MSNASSPSNTISSTVVLTDKGVPDPCISEQILEELIDRLQGVAEFENPANSVKSASAPSDLTKIWFQQDGTGKVVNIKYYNSLKGLWENVLSTDPESYRETLCEENNALQRQANGCLIVEADKILANSTASDNLIDFDSEGDLYLKQTTLQDIAAQVDNLNKCNVLLKDADSKKLSVSKGAGFYQQVGPTGALIQGYIVNENSPDTSVIVQTLDLSTIPNINWDTDCPPDYVQVHAAIVIKSGSGFSTGTWANPAVQIAAGVDQTRVAIAIDSDAQAGSDMNTAIVKLDPSAPETFSYMIVDLSGTTWSNAKNHIGLYIQGLVWSK